MKNLNFIIVEGNLVRDPDFRETDSGLPMCRFTIANNYSYKKQNEWVKDVNFINIVSWARTAENCGQYLKKGDPVRIKGRVDQSYVKREDGRSVSMVDVVAQTVEFLPRRKRDHLEEEIAATTVEEVDSEEVA